MPSPGENAITRGQRGFLPDSKKMGGPGGPAARKTKEPEIRTAEAGPGKDEGKIEEEKGAEVPVTQTPSNDGGRRKTRKTRKSKKATRRRRTTRRR
jgi:hypothetical protein